MCESCADGLCGIQFIVKGVLGYEIVWRTLDLKGLKYYRLILHSVEIYSATI